MLHVHPFALPYKVLPLRLKITYKGFPTWREKQLKGMEICGFATYKFRNSITTEILTMLQIGTNPTALPIGIGSRLRYRRPSECLLCPIWVRIPVILPTVILCLCLKSWQTWIRCQTVLASIDTVLPGSPKCSKLYQFMSVLCLLGITTFVGIQIARQHSLSLRVSQLYVLRRASVPSVELSSLQSIWYPMWDSLVMK